MVKRLILFILWTAVIAWAEFMVWGRMYGPTVHKEPDPKFTIGTAMHMVVGSGDVTVSAASCGKFLLWREDTPDTIIGEKAPVPLGTECASYYAYGPKPIKAGTWLVQSGNPELQFSTNGQSFEVDQVWNAEEAGLQQFVLTICLVMLWFIFGGYVILGIRF